VVREVFGPFVPSLDRAERRTRLWGLRALALILLGAAHPVTAALREAEGDDGALARAEDAIDRLAPIPRRRLLAAYARLVM
jgi:hypothetical protein